MYEKNCNKSNFYKNVKNIKFDEAFLNLKNLIYCVGALNNEANNSFLASSVKVEIGKTGAIKFTNFA